MSPLGQRCWRVPVLAIAHRGIDASFCIVGIPFDIGTANRSGARFGPAAIRHASRMLMDGDHRHWWIDPAALSVADIGDFRIALGDIPKSLSLIEEQAASLDHLVALGGDHTVTLPLLRGCRQQAWQSPGIGALRCPCRHLARKFRPALCPRLRVLPRHRVTG